MTIARLALVAALVLSTALVAHAQSFQGLGHLPDRSNGDWPVSISADGSTVVGTDGFLQPPYEEAFRWTQSGGIVGLGRLPGHNRSYGMGVSEDGSVAVGASSPLGGPPVEAFRWTQVGGMVGLGDLAGGGFGSSASAVSADASVVVGGGESALGREAFRWTEPGGMVGLGDLPGGGFGSSASAVSADGSVIVGASLSRAPDGFDPDEAYRWTEADGMVGLGELPGGRFYSSAYAVSADGSTVVGFSSSATGDEAFRWNLVDGMVGLGDLLAGGSSNRSAAYGVSADGTIVVGFAKVSDSPEVDTAFIWDPENGMQNLRNVLIEDFGLAESLNGWLLLAATDISADGRTIVGYGQSPQSDYQGWIAVVPEPPGYALAIIAAELFAFCMITPRASNARVQNGAGPFVLGVNVVCEECSRLVLASGNSRRG